MIEKKIDRSVSWQGRQLINPYLGVLMDLFGLQSLHHARKTQQEV